MCEMNAYSKSYALTTGTTIKYDERSTMLRDLRKHLLTLGLKVNVKLFPNDDREEARNKVKGLYAMLEMDGITQSWAARHGLTMAQVDSVMLHLSDGSTFQHREYVQAQDQATMWLRHRMEQRLGMASFMDELLEIRKPEKRALEEKWQLEPGTLRARTLKSFCFQEAESISREAKVEWCTRNGHAVLSLQHDGIVVAVKEHTSRAQLLEQLQGVSEQALGYTQPCTIKPPEYLPNATPLAPLNRQQAEAQTQQALGVCNARSPPAKTYAMHAKTWAIADDDADPEQYNAID